MIILQITRAIGEPGYADSVELAYEEAGIEMTNMIRAVMERSQGTRIIIKRREDPRENSTTTLSEQAAPEMQFE